MAGAVFNYLVNCIGAEEGASSPLTLSHTWLDRGAHHVCWNAPSTSKFSWIAFCGCVNYAFPVYQRASNANLERRLVES